MFTSIKPLFRLQNKYSMGVCALLVLALTPLAVAEDSLEWLRIFQKNKMPTNQEIRESYTNFTYKPYEREDLSFSILIPNNGWRDIGISVEPETLQQDEQQLIPLAKQMAPESEKGEAKIEVHYIRLNMEVDLYDYVSMFLEGNKDDYDLLMRRKGQYNRRKVDEVLLASQQNSKRYLSRHTFSRHGDRIFLISSSALEPEFGRYAEAFTAASVSFSAVKNSPNAFAEKMVDFTSSGSPGLRFHYPATWTIEELKGLDAGRNGIDMALTVKDEKGQTVLTYGYINVSAFSKSMKKTPDQVLADLKEDFKRMPISLDKCILRADIFPDLPKPLGKLERWNAIVKGNPGEAGFLVLPKGNDYIVMGLFSMRPEDNFLTWSHTWRIFEIVANDLSAKSIDLASLKYRILPSEKRLKGMVSDTMNEFSRAVGKGSFDAFHDQMSDMFRLQITSAKLHGIFQRFVKIKEIGQLEQHAPILKAGSYVDKDGILKVSGHYPTQPEATTFRLSYMQEKKDWKLLGIHVTMKEMAQDDNRLKDKINVLSTENGGQVVSCSSQYNQSSWGARNLIDGQLDSYHGYASRDRSPAEIVFSLPKIEAITQLCFNPYTTESPNTWAKLVKVEVSTESPEKGFAPVGEFTLHNRQSQGRTPLADQCFDIGAVQARYIKLHLLSNHGGGYIEMGEFKAYAAAN